MLKYLPGSVRTKLFAGEKDKKSRSKGARNYRRKKHDASDKLSSWDEVSLETHARDIDVAHWLLGVPRNATSAYRALSPHSSPMPPPLPPPPPPLRLSSPFPLMSHYADANYNQIVPMPHPRTQRVWPETFPAMLPTVANYSHPSHMRSGAPPAHRHKSSKISTHKSTSPSRSKSRHARAKGHRSERRRRQVSLGNKYSATKSKHLLWQ